MKPNSPIRLYSDILRLGLGVHALGFRAHIRGFRFGQVTVVRFLLELSRRHHAKRTRYAAEKL